MRNKNVRHMEQQFRRTNPKVISIIAKLREKSIYEWNMYTLRKADEMDRQFMALL